MAASSITPPMGLTTTATPSMKEASVVTPVFSTTAEASAANVTWPALKRSKGYQAHPTENLR
jgi:hypothetical protein